jgi:inosine/xanthosine triphosphate pyrophosphatase family protein
MIQLLLATRNPNKTREFAQLLGGNFMVRDLTPESNVPEIVESGTTFEENATLKALAVYDNRGGRSSRHDYEVSTRRKRLWLRSDFCAERV